MCWRVLLLSTCVCRLLLPPSIRTPWPTISRLAASKGSVEYVGGRWAMERRRGENGEYSLHDDQWRSVIEASTGWLTWEQLTSNIPSRDENQQRQTSSDTRGRTWPTRENQTATYWLPNGTYVQDPELKVICSGDCHQQLIHTVADPPFFWEAFVLEDTVFLMASVAADLSFGGQGSNRLRHCQRSSSSEDTPRKFACEIRRIRTTERFERRIFCPHYHSYTW